MNVAARRWASPAGATRRARKRVTSVAGEELATLSDPPEPAGHHGQHGVSRGTTPRVVDRLETVEVEVHDRHRSRVGFTVDDSGQMFFELLPGRQSGQRVADRSDRRNRRHHLRDFEGAEERRHPLVYLVPRQVQWKDTGLDGDPLPTPTQKLEDPRTRLSRSSGTTIQREHMGRPVETGETARQHGLIHPLAHDLFPPPSEGRFSLRVPLGDDARRIYLDERLGAEGHYPSHLFATRHSRALWSRSRSFAHCVAADPPGRAAHHLSATVDAPRRGSSLLGPAGTPSLQRHGRQSPGGEQGSCLADRRCHRRRRVAALGD